MSTCFFFQFFAVFLGPKENVKLVPKFQVVLHLSPYVLSIITSKFSPRRGADNRVLKPITHQHLKADLGICGSEFRLSILLIGVVRNYSRRRFDIYFSDF